MANAYFWKKAATDCTNMRQNVCIKVLEVAFIDSKTNTSLHYENRINSDIIENSDTFQKRVNHSVFFATLPFLILSILICAWPFVQFSNGERF